MLLEIKGEMILPRFDLGEFRKGEGAFRTFLEVNGEKREVEKGDGTLRVLLEINGDTFCCSCSSLEEELRKGEGALRILLGINGDNFGSTSLLSSLTVPTSDSIFRFSFTQVTAASFTAKLLCWTLFPIISLLIFSQLPK